jgi:hypothetical protein
VNLLGSKVVHWDYKDNYTHIDYTWGLECQYDIYPQVVSLIRKYSSLV